MSTPIKRQAGLGPRFQRLLARLAKLIGIAPQPLRGDAQAAADLRREMERQQCEHAARLGELTRQLIRVQDESRRRFALELHDRTSSNLMAIALSLEAVAKNLPASLAATAGARLADARALVADTTVAIRDITAELRPSVLDYAGLTAALHQLARQFTRTTGMSVDIVADELDARCRYSLQTALYYIAQEALTNCAKHACANSALVRIRCSSAQLVMTIADDGAGFDPLALRRSPGKAGLGLLTMSERARAAGGTMDIRSQPGRGTVIRVDIGFESAASGGNETVAAGAAGGNVP